MRKLLLGTALVLLTSCSFVKQNILGIEEAPQFGGIIAPEKVELAEKSARVIPFGQDQLGASKFAKVAINNAPAGQGEGIFSAKNVFGDGLPVIKGWIARGVPFIRVQLAWHDNHHFTEKDFPSINKEAARLCPTVKANPQVKWYFSGATEHDLKGALALKLAQQVSATCPEATYVNNPLKGDVINGYINEFHGGGLPKISPYAFSFDGTAAEDSNVEKVKQNFRNAEYFMLWGPRYNGRWESNDSTPRPQRKGWPDGKYIKSLAYLAGNKGPAKIPSKWLLKSHSENKSGTDSRAEKPVMIIPIKAKAVVFKKGNKVVQTLPYYGTFPGNLYRYYSGIWGYELGEVDIFVNGKKEGYADAGFRQGYYQ